MLSSLPLNVARGRTSLTSFARHLGDGASGGDADDFSYDGPKTLTSFKLMQGSVLMFAFMAFINFAIGNIFTGQGTALNFGLLENHDLLTAEVIRPPSQSLLHQSIRTTKRRSRLSMSKNSHRGQEATPHHHPPKGVLGTAAISSVTEWLGPILPFAGGIDLRRLRPSESYAWICSYFFHGAGDQHQQRMESIPRGGGASTHASNVVADTMIENASMESGEGDRSTTGGGAIHRSRVGRRRKESGGEGRGPLVLSAPEPFFPTDEISMLALEEMAQGFRYIVSPESFSHYTEDDGEVRDDGSLVEKTSNNSTNIQEHETRAVDSNERTERFVRAMEDASAKSRGEGVFPTSRPSLSSLSSSEEHEIENNKALRRRLGDVDASRFCAVLRIFAEWRMLRLVPNGYKGYAVGMSLGHKDVVQNLAKIETAMREWIDHRQYDLEETDGGGVEHSHGPTLHQLLEYERDAGIHADLPRLNDNTAAMGLLWVYRQLRYQTAIFENILDTSGEYPDAEAAVGGAYTDVYGSLHGWAVQKIFNYSFRAAPEIAVIFNYVNPHRLEEVMEEIRLGVVEHVVDDNTADDATSNESNIVPMSNEEFLIKTTTSTSLANGNGQEDQSKGRVLILDAPSPYEENQSEILMGGYDVKEDYDTKFPPLQGSGNIWVDMGSHVVNEWNKLGYEIDKLGKHVENEVNKVGNEWDKISNKIVFEWDKLASGVAGAFGIHSAAEEGGNDLAFDTSPVVQEGRRFLEGEELEQYISIQMERNIREHIALYLQFVKPLLSDLMGLLDEMNMDDPTKV